MEWDGVGWGGMQWRKGPEGVEEERTTAYKKVPFGTPALLVGKRGPSL